MLNNRFTSAEVAYFLVANFFVLGIVVYASAVNSSYPDFYYLSVQEDEYLEWASFWSFLLATGAYYLKAASYRLEAHRIPWFLWSMALLCFFVAMEEISWGQRLFGYRPPTFFLEHNFQQEFNIHNIVDTDYRNLALKIVIVGYGIILPLAAQFSYVKPWFERFGIVTGTTALVPAFAGTFLLYSLYPWSHSGEWVELMLGLSLLFSAVLAPRYINSDNQSSREDHVKSSKITILAFVAVMGLGFMSAAFSRAQRYALPINLQAARIEVDAISHDFASGLAESRCNLHKRLYTFVEKYGQSKLFEGSYAGLQAQGLPKERAEFFLDPWNSPYWIRDRCDKKAGRRVIFIYSFGPDRRRDSSRTEILGDDIGMHISSD